MKPMLLPLLAAVLLAGCQTTAETAPDVLGRASLQLASGNPAGTARLFANGSEATLSISLSGLPEGTHGVHLHTTGSCDPPAFMSAGPHLNPNGRQHGSENPQGAHLGDLPNVLIGAAGSGTVSALLPGTAQEVISQLFDGDGTAIVVHAEADDYRTDSSGYSGSRIACGVLLPG